MSVSMTSDALCTSFSIFVILRVSCCSCERFFSVVVASAMPALFLDHVRIAGGASAAAVVTLHDCALLAGGPLVSAHVLPGLDCCVFVAFFCATGMCASSTL